MSRSKGRNGERELELLLQAAGAGTERAIGGRHQQSGDILATFPDLPPMAWESRRRERLLVPSWCAAHEASTPDGVLPIVAWRANRMPWRAALLLDDLLTLIAPNKEDE